MNSTTQRFARRMGENVRDADYASALSGPRPSNGAAWWIAAILLPILALSVAWL